MVPLPVQFHTKSVLGCLAHQIRLLRTRHVAETLPAWPGGGTWNNSGEKRIFVEVMFSVMNSG
jgi:hypothetical protein